MFFLKKRIWELDFFRGLFILGMIVVHLIDDLVYVFGLIELSDPLLSNIYDLCTRWGGILFILISGICVTFSSRPIKRGLQVVGCGLIVTAVSVGMYLLGFSDGSIIIYFGILHCLGTCMLLWPVFKKLPGWASLITGVLAAAIGLHLEYSVRVDFNYLVPLGLFSNTFVTADYFPLLPNLGYFLIGSALGRWLYPQKQTLFPNVNDRNPVIRFFSFFGRHSLLIYLLHQPLLAALVYVWDLIF